MQSGALNDLICREPAYSNAVEKYKTAKFIIILGGPDAYEGIGDIVKQLINEIEQSFLRTKGNRKKHGKEMSRAFL